MSICLRRTRFAALGLSVFLAGVLPAPAQVKIYWTATDASGAYVVRADGDGSNPTNIVSGAANILGPNGLEYANGRLFWPDQQLNAVQQVNPDGTGLATFTAAENPYDVFAGAQRTYWTSQELNYIDTRLNDGSGYLRLLASPDVNRPFAIEVTDSSIYWSQVSGSGSIQRADLAGANIVTVIPRAFVYDLQVTANHLYFADNNFPSAIKRANLDGSGVTNLVTDSFGIGLINGLCITGDAIYWSALMDGNGGGIRRAGLTGSNPVNLYNAPAGTSVRGVVVIPEAVTPAAPRFTHYSARPGEFTFTLQVEPGKTYRVETSGSWTNWTEMTNFLSTSTSVTLTNALPADAGHLFHRAWTP